MTVTGCPPHDTRAPIEAGSSVRRDNEADAMSWATEAERLAELDRHIREAHAGWESRRQILLVDAVPESVASLSVHAVHHGFHLRAVQDLQAAKTTLAVSTLPHVLLLASSDRGCLSFLKGLRAAARTRGVPVVVIASGGDEDDCVSTLEAGADDYVRTPFSHAEFFARLKAVLRPRYLPAPEPVVDFDGLHLDPQTQHFCDERGQADRCLYEAE